MASVGDAVVVGDAEDGIQTMSHGHTRTAVTGHSVSLQQSQASPHQLFLVVPVCQELDDLLLGVVHLDHLLVVHQRLQQVPGVGVPLNLPEESEHSHDGVDVVPGDVLDVSLGSQHVTLFLVLITTAFLSTLQLIFMRYNSNIKIN